MIWLVNIIFSRLYFLGEIKNLFVLHEIKEKSRRKRVNKISFWTSFGWTVDTVYKCAVGREFVY